MANEFVPMYDLEALSEPQRAEYVKRVCKHMGVPDDLNLVMLTYLDEQDGPRRLVAYAKRGATEIIRNNRGISVTDTTSKEIGGSVVFTVTGKDNTGRQEMSTGSKYIANLIGKDLDDAIMTAQTRATRRMTLQFVGAGVLDESEVNPKATVEVKNTTAIVPAAQPVAAPVSAPGNDITEALPVEMKTFAANVQELKKEDYTVGLVVPTEAEMATFNEQQKKLREDAIAQLNQKTETKKRTRKSKTTVDLGPSTNPVPAKPAEPVAQVTTQAAPAVAEPQPAQVIPPAPAPVVNKPKLSAEQIKPFRQRQFKLITDLEMAGFAPKEGVGNLDKMRSFVGLMFPEVTNFNELNAEQWEKYLTAVETKIASTGAPATIKYIEDAIGV